jgi:hypothetical protein
MNTQPLFQRFGRRMRLTGEDNDRAFYAFLQPLRYKNKMYLFGVNTPIGYNCQGHHLYIGPPHIDLTALPRKPICALTNPLPRGSRGNGVSFRPPGLCVAVVRTVVGQEEPEEGGVGT